MKNWGQVSRLTTDIYRYILYDVTLYEFSCGVGREAFMLMHETTMHENYDFKWSRKRPFFFIFYRGKPEDPEENPLLSRLLFLSFFFLLSPKKENKKKTENRKEENRKKENRKRIPFFYCQQVSFFWFYDNPTGLVSYFSAIRHRDFFCSNSGTDILYTTIRHG